MIRAYHKWRYYRKEKRPSFSFHRRDHDNFGPAFGHYLSQRGSHQEANTPYERKKRLKKAGKILLGLAALAILSWLAIEITFALRFF